MQHFFFLSRIPDLVKDPEAEAAFEALRGLMEANIQKEYEEQQIAKQNKKPTARKSTGPHAKGGPKKATARKSTAASRMKRAEFSYYGLPVDPVNFNEISTRMSIGGMEITLNASKMAGLVNLKPIVQVRDCGQSAATK